jgi:putative DNA primase/helicase
LIELKKESEDQIKSHNRMIKSLQHTPFKNHVIQELSDRFNDFYENCYDFDEKKNLIGFTNGVYDLDSFEFRDGQPNDLITFSTNYAYDANDDKVIQDDIIGFIYSITRTEEIAEYLLKVLSYMLHGHKGIESFFFLTGSGRNGKGTLMTLMGNTLGDYYFEPSIEMFTTVKLQSDVVNPELKNTKGKRMLVSSEPDDTDSNQKFRANKLKQWRGNDTITCRGLYEATSSFKPQFGMMFQMNSIPEMSKADSAIEQTLRIIEFPFKFVTTTPRVYYEKEGDPNIKERFSRDKRYFQQCMLILLKYFKNHVKGKKDIPAPEEVLQTGKEYVQENNPLLSWFNETIEITNNEEDKISANECYQSFKEHTKSSWSHTKFGREMFNVLGMKAINHRNVKKLIKLKFKNNEELEFNLNENEDL